MYYTLKKVFTFDYAHALTLPYESKCKNVHGHTAKVVIRLRTTELNDEGMVIDFTHLKEIITPIIESMDHAFLMSTTNDPDIVTKHTVKYELNRPNTTAEYIAECIYEELYRKFRKKYDMQVEFFETPTNSVCVGQF